MTAVLTRQFIWRFHSIGMGKAARQKSETAVRLELTSPPPTRIWTGMHPPPPGRSLFQMYSIGQHWKIVCTELKYSGIY